MGQGLSCGQFRENDLFIAVQTGELETVEAMADENPNLLMVKTVHGKLSALHGAAATGEIEVLCVLLDRCSNPDILNLHKQTPLMLAATNGKISCMGRLIQAGANILLFDTLHGRTCLDYAAYYGHSDCLQLILSAAHSSCTVLGVFEICKHKGWKWCNPTAFGCSSKRTRLRSCSIEQWGSCVCFYWWI